MKKRGKKDRNILRLMIFVIILGVISLFFDERVLMTVKTLQNSFLDGFLGLFKPILSIMLIALIFVLFLYYEHKRKWIKPFILTILSSTLISFIIKFLIMRPRPFNLVKVIPLINMIDYSFPSSHTVAIFSILPILDKEFPKLKYLWIILALIIAFSRIYFQVHYLSDVLFGMVIGYLIGFVIVKKYSKKFK